MCLFFLPAPVPFNVQTLTCSSAVGNRLTLTYVGGTTSAWLISSGVGDWQEVP